jgi:hypothetical protein
MLRNALALVAILAFVSSSTAQQQAYGGLQSRTVKALSQQQIDDLKSGRGMGLALTAELNGYPGPPHVLELATPLALTEAQRQKMQELIAAMKADTIPLGERLITHEQELDDLFAKKAVTPESLEAVTATIGSAQGALRAAHLRIISTRSQSSRRNRCSATCSFAVIRRRQRQAPTSIGSTDPLAYSGRIALNLHKFTRSRSRPPCRDRHANDHRSPLFRIAGRRRVPLLSAQTTIRRPAPSKPLPRGSHP